MVDLAEVRRLVRWVRKFRELRYEMGRELYQRWSISSTDSTFSIREYTEDRSELFWLQNQGLHAWLDDAEYVEWVFETTFDQLNAAREAVLRDRLGDDYLLLTAHPDEDFDV